MEFGKSQRAKMGMEKKRRASEWCVLNRVEWEKKNLEIFLRLLAIKEAGVDFFIVPENNDIVVCFTMIKDQKNWVSQFSFLSIGLNLILCRL